MHSRIAGLDFYTVLWSETSKCIKNFSFLLVKSIVFLHHANIIIVLTENKIFMYKNVFLQTHLKTTFKSLQSTHESQIKAQPRNIMQEGTASFSQS